MERIGRYTVLGKIGSGGMAEVFLARSQWAQGTEKILVIKKIHPALAENSRFIDMFVDEARVAMRLNHTNIVQVYTFEQVDGAHILAMEYVDGPDLLGLETDVRKRDQRVPVGLAALVAAEVAKGLDYAHSRRDDRGEPLDIVHRDVSPQNILISREGAVKVADFGIARARWLNEEAAGTVKGKFGYMAPEQAAGEKVDRRSDVYALGVVLFEMLIGRPLLRFSPGEDPKEVIKGTDHPAPSAYDPAIPAALDEIVSRAVAREPENRFQTAREMAKALVRYLHSEEEIYDADALAAWIETLSPTDPETAAITGAPVGGRADRSAEHLIKESTAPFGKIGEEEQRAAVVVSGRFSIEPHPSRNELTAEIIRLVGEMAFKAEGIFEQRTSGFSVFLGVIHSSMDDAIMGIRLANDVLDAARALGRDHRLKIDVKLSVNRGMIRCLRTPNQEVPKFDPEPALKERAAALIDSVREGSIAVGDQIFRMARREYNFDVVGNRDESQTGDAEPIYLVTGAKSRRERILEDTSTGSFLGRKEELDRLDRALRATISGRLVILKVTGEMGVGTSRLARRFLEIARARGARVTRTECLFAERDRPMAAAAVATRTMLDIAEGKGSGELAERLGTVLLDVPRYRERQTRFLGDLLDTPDLLWARYPGGRRELIRRTAAGLGVLVSMLVADRPTVALVENAHWLDGPSIDVLAELAAQRASIPLMLLLVGRPETMAGRRIAELSSMEVGELSDPLMRSLVMEHLGSSESMEDLADKVIARAHGNPFFASEIIDSLIEQKIIVPLTGEGKSRYRQARPGTIRLPATMEGIAAARIDALAVEQRTVLRTAAAVGASFTPEIVAELTGSDVDREIEALVARQMLVPMPGRPGGQPAFRFRQSMVREAAYGGLSNQDRRRIHRAMADRLIAAAEKGEAVPNVRIAWHLDQAGQTDRAGLHYLAAGNSAISFYSDREALKLFDRAIPRLPADSREQFEAIVRREMILRELGRFKARGKDVTSMVEIARALGDDDLSSRALTRRAQLKFDLGDFGAAAQDLGNSLEAAVRTDSLAGQVEALRLLAYVANEEGHLIRALDCCNRALGVIRPEDPDSAYLKARALGIKGFVLLNMGHLTDAAAPLAEGVVLFRRLNKRRNESQVKSNLALLAQARGELGEAVEFLESAMRIDSEVRNVSARGRKLAALGNIQAELGDFQAAIKNLSTSRVICEENREPVGEIEADLGLADLLLTTGELTRAQRILERVGRNDLVLSSRLLLVRHRQLASQALNADGQVKAAKRLAEEAVRIALEAGMNGEAVHGRVRLGQILAVEKRVGEALTATRRATDLLGSLKMVRRAEEVWWLQARTMHEVGNAFRTERALEEARREVARKRAKIKTPRKRARYDAHPLVVAINKGFD